MKSRAEFHDARARAAARFASREARWAAVRGRDPEADGLFLYAVRSTGVFCRPVCRSRPPREHNVVFFDTCEDAERAGYRACRRCRPGEDAGRDPRGESDAALVERACAAIRDSAEPLGLEALARRVGTERFRLHRAFRSTLSVTPREYRAQVQANALQHELAGGRQVAAATYLAGYGSGSRVYEQAGSALGMRPAEYRRGGAGQTIRFAVQRCSLGWLGVAATERGICMLALGDSPDALRDAAQRRFAQALLEDADGRFAAWVEVAVATVDEPQRAAMLPLDVRGTAFQRRVWRALQRIPSGTTTTYTEVARRIGRPDAVRAVAGAIAANEVAIAIPCHRVIRSDGALSGYRWGVERKRALLEREAVPDRGAVPDRSALPGRQAATVPSRGRSGRSAPAVDASALRPRRVRAR